MAEIKINISELNNLIPKIQEVKNCANGIYSSNTPPETIGGGLAVGELEELSNLYHSIYRDIEELASNTVLFLQNVRDTYVEVDVSAASRMTSGNSGTGTK